MQITRLIILLYVTRNNTILPMNTKTNAERAKEFRERRQKDGLKSVRLWMPADKVEKLKEIAEAMKDGKTIVIHNETPNPDAETSEKG